MYITAEVFLDSTGTVDSNRRVALVDFFVGRHAEILLAAYDPENVPDGHGLHIPVISL